LKADEFMEEKIWSCILKRFTGKETKDSRLFLDEWLKINTSNSQKYNEAKSIWELSRNLQPEVPEISFQQFKDQLKLTSENKAEKGFAFRKYGIAAALAGIFILVGLYYYKFNPVNVQTENLIVKRAGAGRVVKILLPDSSEVWLNSGSEISFAKAFKGQKIRTVKLIGEAYFEVTHDSEHPFVVTSGQLRTTVYGTSFSVRAYENETKTTVAVNSGKVGVVGLDKQHENFAVMLLPNDKLSYTNKGGELEKSLIINKDVNAWIEGSLVFEQTPLPEVFETLSRKYKVKINTENKSYTGCRLTARFNNQPIQAVLKALRLALNIQSKQIGKTIYLKGGNCM
jgi:transmembrane sensor